MLKPVRACVCRRRRLLLTATAALAARDGHAAAEAWPSRPVRFIVSFPAGASTDLCARLLAEGLRVRTGQPVIVENRPGVNGALAAAAVAAAPPDGYTLLVTGTSTMTVNHLLFRDVRYHPLRDLFPIATITASPYILAINPKNPRTRSVRSLHDLVALARERPGGVTYGSAGIGNLQHLNVELLSRIAGISLLHVPYRGAAQAENALVAGEIDVVLETPAAMPLFRSDVLLPIASGGSTRWRDLPDVPTMVESGYPDLVLTFWNGVIAPANTPAAVVEQIYRAIDEAAQLPATRQVLLGQGDVVVLDPERFRERIMRGIELNAEVIRNAGIEMQ